MKETDLYPLCIILHISFSFTRSFQISLTDDVRFMFVSKMVCQVKNESRDYDNELWTSCNEHSCAVNDNLSCHKCLNRSKGIMPFRNFTESGVVSLEVFAALSRLLFTWPDSSRSHTNGRIKETLWEIPRIDNITRR